MRSQNVCVDNWFNSLFELCMPKQDRDLKGIEVVQGKLGWAPKKVSNYIEDTIADQYTVGFHQKRLQFYGRQH